jgi:hypothetical protein
MSPGIHLESAVIFGKKVMIMMKIFPMMNSNESDKDSIIMIIMVKILMMILVVMMVMIITIIKIMMIFIMLVMIVYDACTN